MSLASGLVRLSKMLKYDFHIHSALSPCGDEDMTPNNIVNMAYIAGLDAIAITDHNTVGNVRAAQKVGESVGITVLAGMEIETAEEVHVLTLFPDIQSAEKVAKVVYESLPSIENKPEIFGRQLYMDENDRVTGEEKKLLISSTTLPIEKVFALVKEVGGFAAPAHVDRHSYSVLTNLGFIPEEINCRWIEISNMVTNHADYIAGRKDLANYLVMQNSDAHYLQDIAIKENFLPCSISELFGKGAK